VPSTRSSPWRPRRPRYDEAAPGSLTMSPAPLHGRPRLALGYLQTRCDSVCQRAVVRIRCVGMQVHVEDGGRALPAQCLAPVQTRFIGHQRTRRIRRRPAYESGPSRTAHLRPGNQPAVKTSNCRQLHSREATAASSVQRDETECIGGYDDAPTRARSGRVDCVAGCPDMDPAFDRGAALTAPTARRVKAPHPVR
jgi:hypothetical protein